MGKVIEFPIKYKPTTEEYDDDFEYEDYELAKAYREYYAEYLENN